MSSEQCCGIIYASSNRTKRLPSKTNRKSRRKCSLLQVVVILLVAVCCWMAYLVVSHQQIMVATSSGSDGLLGSSTLSLSSSSPSVEESTQVRKVHPSVSSESQSTTTTSLQLNGNSERKENMIPLAFQRMAKEARTFRETCNGLKIDEMAMNMSFPVDLPSFGIIDAIESFSQQPEHKNMDEWQCKMPPTTSCDTTKFSMIMLGYGEDRVLSIRNKVRSFLGENKRDQTNYRSMLEEVILVWNNPIPLGNISETGSELVRLAKEPNNPFISESTNTELNPFRIFEPHQEGLGGSLMNRYHPKIKPKSEAILFYDDDGPFYNHWPIRSAFELWRRNSDSQVGAMPRAFTLSDRQKKEKNQLLDLKNLQVNDDKKFVSHCRHQGDAVFYDFTSFCMFHANMVLPSGSFLHRNYMCYIWHPAMKPLRDFVFRHDTHPDDMTVSMLVSHLNGRSPLTYPRRIPHAPRPNRRRLSHEDDEDSEDTEELEDYESDEESRVLLRRRLLWEQDGWGDRRKTALNSLVAYFGSISSGSLGWCYKTNFHTVSPSKHGPRNDCKPEMAQMIDDVPWLMEGGYQNDICPGGTVK